MIAIAQKISQELNVRTEQVNAAINLLNDGATVPFIARYRKEKTGGLTDTHLRTLAQRLDYLRALEERKQVILKNISQQNLLTPQLQQQITSTENKTQLEDLYLPFKPKRKTKGQMAITAGLAPLADTLFKNWQLSPAQEAKAFIQPESDFANEEEVLEGVTAILAEQFAEDAQLLKKLRQYLLKNAHVTTKLIKSKEQGAQKFRDYFDHSEKLNKVPSHRALAMLRGKNEGFLRLNINADPQEEKITVSNAEHIIIEHYGLRLTNQPAATFLTSVIHFAWKQKLFSSLSTELLGNLREQAESQAINVFAKNLSDVLLAAPAGAKITMGIDPGLRTGCKIAIVDGTGKLLQHSTIFPHEPQNNWDKSVRTLVNLSRQHKVELIAVGNGTGSRETDKLAAEVIKLLSEAESPIKLSKVLVSEAGASVYSASELAANEFPDLDVSIRGAVSIARRLQDPLAELVKIEPKAIGVGQYQHDVSQSQLSESLSHVIEDCVNAVGVELNSASAELLSHVAGLNKTIAKNIVNYRDQHGAFEERKQLLKIPRLGPKAFEQAAGFLRINNGKNPLDASGVHPETYPVVEKIIQQLNNSLTNIIGNKEQLNKINIEQLSNAEFGEVTIKDIITELEKPGRDPRPTFKTATFQTGIEKISDLKIGMVLEGVISNVANFGAFVDIGVHQDGLVHISALTNKFVSDPREIVKAGDIVKVKVMEVDANRKRINLTMRLDDATNTPQNNKKNEQNKPTKQQNKNHTSAKPKAKPAVTNAAMGNAFADAFSKLKK